MDKAMYDPLVHAIPESRFPDPQSYWLAVSGPEPQDDGVLQGDVEADVAIIGGGYTGLTSALVLARDHGIRAVVLEARSAAWGCSGRNGSFARISGGRVALSKLVEIYGRDVARAYFKEMQAGLDTVRSLIRDGRIDCDVQPDGVYKIAALASHAEGLRREAALYNDVMRYPARFVPAQDLPGIHNGSEAFGALHLPDGFSMNPLKLARGIHAMARTHGARVHTNSPVTDWR